MLMRVARMLIKLGAHGKRHKLAIKKLLDWMRCNGIGPQ